MKKENFWIQCLDNIKKKISEQAFETWFDSVELISLDKEEINLQVPNKFHYEWLESKYRHLIDEVIMNYEDEKVIMKVKSEVNKLMSNYPIFV